MGDIRRTIINTFADEETCDMFIMVIEKMGRIQKSTYRQGNIGSYQRCCRSPKYERDFDL